MTRNSEPEASVPAVQAGQSPDQGSLEYQSDWETIAAIDLGSNSFHMVIARVDEAGHVHIVDRLREQVQLGAGLDDRDCLSPEAQARGIACLQRFGDRVREVSPGKVAAVGTNTLRRAHNGEEFLSAASEALGHPIEVIAGREEARLIYLGVAHTHADDKGRRLVIDIGGGSTECIIGERFQPRFRESLYMGCVSASLEYFGDGQITEKQLRRAEIAARLELRPIEQRYRRIGWQDCIGASGTIRAVQSVLQANGWSEDGITPFSLQRLRKALLKAGSAANLRLPGLSEERAPVFPGGVAVLTGVFEALRIGHMHVSDGALREGLLYDLLGRIRHEDVRERTILTMARRYHVSLTQARRVASDAEQCRKMVATDWYLEGEETTSMLQWAAMLHEVGLAIAHAQYHKHGAYLVQHSDMRGFSRQNQQLLAFLIRGHRRKFPKADLAALPRGAAGAAERLCILLRLAVLLNHGRRKRRNPLLSIVAGEQSLDLVFAEGWLDEHPLTRTNLEQEAEYLKAIKFKLRFL